MYFRHEKVENKNKDIFLKTGQINQPPVELVSLDTTITHCLNKTNDLISKTQNHLKSKFIIIASLRGTVTMTR